MSHVYPNKALRDALFNAYLDLSQGTADTLKTIAYAKLVLWTLFLENRTLTRFEITNRVAVLIGSDHVPEEQIRIALSHLKMRKFINEVEVNETYQLEEEQKTEMQKTYTSSLALTDKILDTYFLKSLPREQLRKWFNDANEAYFSRRADKLVKLYTKKSNLGYKFEGVIKEATLNNRLSAYEAQLIQGYKEFLNSDDPEVQKRIFTLMGAVLSTKVVSANLSPDFLSIEKYRDAELILDTNVLFKVIFREVSHQADTFETLGKVFATLGISLVMAPFTQEEYEKVKEKSKKKLLDIQRKYTPSIINGAKADSFIRVAQETKCKTEEDIDRLFSSYLRMPESIGEVKIKVLSPDQVSSIDFDSGRKYDRELFQKISNAMQEVCGRPKTEGATIHDVKLDKLVRERKQVTNKTFVLSCDSSLETLALREVNEKEEPNWINLQSFIQILAVNGGGLDYSTDELSSLTRVFIELEEFEKVEDYGVDDLLFLVQLNERIDELPETQVISLLNKVHRARLSSDEGSKFEIRRELERSLVKKTGDLDKAVEEKNEIIGNKDELILQLTTKLAKQDELKVRLKNWAIFSCQALVSLCLVVLLIFYLWKPLTSSQKQDERFERVEIVLTIFIPIVYLYKQWGRTRRKIQEDIKRVSESHSVVKDL